MATHTSAELDVFDCNLGEGGLDEFEPETPRDGLWMRVPGPAVDVQRRAPDASSSRQPVWLLAVPAVAAAVLAGAWIGIRAIDVPTVRVAAGVTPPVAAAAPAVPVAPPARVLSTRVVAAPVAVPSPQPDSTPLSGLDSSVAPTLAAVSDAYRTLDAAALAAVWPGADTAGLAESFSTLKYQSLVFDRCQVHPNGEDGAMASCEVSIAAAPKDGDPTLRRRRESWTLALGRDGDRWTIAGVTVR